MNVKLKKSTLSNCVKALEIVNCAPVVTGRNTKKSFVCTRVFFALKPDLNCKKGHFPQYKGTFCLQENWTLLQPKFGLFMFLLKISDIEAA